MPLAPGALASAVQGRNVQEVMLSHKSVRLQERHATLFGLGGSSVPYKDVALTRGCRLPCTNVGAQPSEAGVEQKGTQLRT